MKDIKPSMYQLFAITFNSRSTLVHIAIVVSEVAQQQQQQKQYQQVEMWSFLLQAWELEF